MAQHPNRRIDPQIIQADQSALSAVQHLIDYSPVKSEYDVSALTNARGRMEAARLAELHAQNALNAARDAAMAAEWEFHDMILGAKTQVIAQYGSDSDQVSALGLKKKSDRKRPTSRSKTTTSQTHNAS